MKEIIDYLITEKEWLFSGIGVFVLGLFSSINEFGVYDNSYYFRVNSCNRNYRSYGLIKKNIGK